MAYDAAAKRLVVKVIGTVESGLNYEAINYNDPITVGIAQWYGTRAAAILRRTIDENIASWSGVPNSQVVSDLANIPASDPWWNSRRLTQAEGESLRPMLGKNRAIQEDQCVQDMEVYKDVAINIGMDPEANTKAVLFFFTMYHQGPVYAFQVIDAVGPDATLEEIHAGALANPVLGQYSNRYNEAYEIIKTGDVPEDGEPEEPQDPGTGDPDDGGDAEPSTGSGVRYITSSGRDLLLQLAGGKQVFAYKVSSGRWNVSGSTAEAEPVEPPAEEPENPTPDKPPVTEPGTGKWVHPLPGADVTSPYGPRSFDGFHAGTDFSTTTAARGGNIVAPCDMEIVQAWEAGTGGLEAAGTFVKGITRTGTPYTFSFFHMAAGSLAVKKGDVVSAGTKLGVEGGTGNVTGTHLHLEAWDGHRRGGFRADSPWYYGDGTPIDVVPILEANGVNI